MKKYVKWFSIVLVLCVVALLTINLILYSIPQKTQGSIALFSVGGEKKVLTYSGKVYDSLFFEKRFLGKVTFDGIEYVDQESAYKESKNLIERLEPINVEYNVFVFRAVTDTLIPGNPLSIHIDKKQNIAVVKSLDADSVWETETIYYGPADTADEAKELASNFFEYWN